MRTRKTLARLVFALALTVPAAAYAQTTELPAVQFDWGAIHRASGQALAINFVVPDSPDFGDPLGFIAALRLMDGRGNVIAETTAEAMPGRVLTFVLTSDVRGAMKTIPGDIYAFVDPNLRVIQASTWVASLSNRVALTPERVVGTLEVIEISSGRVVDFAINPRATVPDAPD